ncbi:hypothetical protein [Streptomyces collinus]|uniref:hypothetical protein n=1 Tax=Streptomyces collinus TaxID=42684 RepID=UPI00368AFDF0
MEFIFMLTQNDRTIPNALDVLHEVSKTGLRHIGFKDVGATPDLQRSLTAAAREAGMTVYLEVVSVDKEDELAAVDAAIAAGVDWIVGGKFADEVTARLKGTRIKFAPFPGRVVGHPSTLEGSVEEIAAHARALVATPGVSGVDLLAYRHSGVDPLELTRAVAAAIDAPVIAAGSVLSEQQVHGLAAAGAWGFTIGSAIFEGVLPGNKDVAAQVRTALSFAQGASV